MERLGPMRAKYARDRGIDPVAMDRSIEGGVTCASVLADHAIDRSIVRLSSLYRHRSACILPSSQEVSVGVEGATERD